MIRNTTTAKIIFQFLIIIFHIDLLHADWNQDFDSQSHQLIQALPLLQHPDYIQQYDFFKNIRNVLVKDQTLIIQLQNAQMDDKFIIQKPELNIIIKKRRNNEIRDLYPWELSYLTNSNTCIVPSFPIELGGKQAIIQIIEPFQYKLINEEKSKSILKKITLENYWKALFQVYLLGICDLVGQNIGVNDAGIIRLFDTEHCLIYHPNIPFKSRNSFQISFVCQAFDWPQYDESLDEATAKKLRAFIRDLAHFEENLKIYSNYRPIYFVKKDLKYRLDKIRTFPIKKGITFHDFIAWIYPKMSSGLDELSQIISSILKKNVGYGTSIFFVCRKLKKIKLSIEEQESIRNWITTYID